MSAPRDLGRQARVEERADEQLEAVLLAQGQDAVEAAPDAELREELDLREIERHVQLLTMKRIQN